MKKVGLFLWRCLAVVIAIEWAVNGAMFAGAWAGWNEPPTPALSTQAIVFIGAAMLMLKLNIPALREQKQKGPGLAGAS